MRLYREPAEHVGAEPSSPTSPEASAPTGRCSSSWGARRRQPQALSEGLQILLPLLRAYPQAFGDLAKALLAGYLFACDQADRALVQAVQQVLP